jgi:hypothetical protein
MSIQSKPYSAVLLEQSGNMLHKSSTFKMAHCFLVKYQAAEETPLRIAAKSSSNSKLKGCRKNFPIQIRLITMLFPAGVEELHVVRKRSIQIPDCCCVTYLPLIYA